MASKKLAYEIESRVKDTKNSNKQGRVSEFYLNLANHYKKLGGANLLRIKISELKPDPEKSIFIFLAKK